MDDVARVVTELYLRRRSAGLTRKEFLREVDAGCEQPMGVTQEALYHWETRACEPRPYHADPLTAFFDDVTSIAELGLGHAPGTAFHWTWASDAEIEAEVGRRRAARTLASEETKMDRRTVVQTVLIGSGAALLPVRPLTATAQLLGGRPTIGLGDVRSSQDVATHLAAEYLANPSDETVRAALAHARTLTDRLKRASMTDAVRTGLAAVASDAAALAGHAQKGAGPVAEAGRWFDDAIDLAREAGDRRLEALAIASTSWTVSESTMLGYGDRSRSLAALQGAAALDRYLPPAGRAWVSGLLALDLATANDDAGSGRALEHALAAAARLGSGGPGWGWYSEHGQLSGWDGARAVVYTGARPLYLGRHRDAAPLLDSALDGTAVPVRRATLHLDLTRVGVGLDEPERARAQALAVLDQVDQHELGIIREELRLVRASFPSEWPEWVTQELDERLALA
ncbi:MAG: hypothetical protein ACRDYA_15260 [Egibacteraceae bacterium]